MFMSEELREPVNDLWAKPAAGGISCSSRLVHEEGHKGSDGSFTGLPVRPHADFNLKPPIDDGNAHLPRPQHEHEHETPIRILQPCSWSRAIRSMRLEDNRGLMESKFQTSVSARRRRRAKVHWCAVAGVLLACFSLLFSLSLLSFWSCQSSTFFSGRCKKQRRVYKYLAAMGFFPGPPHRCPISLMGDAGLVLVPEWKSSVTMRLPHLTYIMEDPSRSPRAFGGHQTWQQREESFTLNSSMKVHCGFAQPDGPELLSTEDGEFVRRCRFVVATCILDNYDRPHQPLNVSRQAKELFCFVMVVDHVSFAAFQHENLLSKDAHGGQWVGLWRVLELMRLPYDEPRRSGKVPKLLLHRLFPEVHYSIWIDGKLQLVTDPLLILDRYLWRANQSFAIAQHKHHRSVYDEADACKRRKRYARPLIDKQMEVYRNEGLHPWSPAKLPLLSDVPEGALIVREHTTMTNLFCCLWFNEVNRFTPRDQLSFGYVVHRLQLQQQHHSVLFSMFPNCEYNTLVVLHKHVREHSSRLEWAKRMDELQEQEQELELAPFNATAIT